MHIYLGADHRGFELKNRIAEWLKSESIPFTDFGAKEYDAEDDYNVYAKTVAQAVLGNHGPSTFGILICGSGQGIAMQANRFKGIRAAICPDTATAIEARGHNDANILCIPADQQINDFASVIDSFIHTPPLEDPKYKRRNQELDKI
ncbi:RpiB/LacA/LacB family sugar-phosphate isomerase [Candidatus Saccharibacteria bacterium]|nr:RpiB/LacA/LacB family sugar-phosphate isomerase [Candidatus Saccharibacteria bacterium]